MSLTAFYYYYKYLRTNKGTCFTSWKSQTNKGTRKCIDIDIYIYMFTIHHQENTNNTKQDHPIKGTEKKTLLPRRTDLLTPSLMRTQSQLMQQQNGSLHWRFCFRQSPFDRFPIKTMHKSCLGSTFISIMSKKTTSSNCTNINHQRKILKNPPTNTTHLSLAEHPRTAPAPLQHPAEPPARSATSRWASAHWHRPGSHRCLRLPWRWNVPQSAKAHGRWLKDGHHGCSCHFGWVLGLGNSI